MIDFCWLREQQAMKLIIKNQFETNIVSKTTRQQKYNINNQNKLIEIKNDFWRRLPKNYNDIEISGNKTNYGSARARIHYFLIEQVAIKNKKSPSFTNKQIAFITETKIPTVKKAIQMKSFKDIISRIKNHKKCYSNTKHKWVLNKSQKEWNLINKIATCLSDLRINQGMSKSKKLSQQIKWFKNIFKIDQKDLNCFIQINGKQVLLSTFIDDEPSKKESEEDTVFNDYDFDF